MIGRFYQAISLLFIVVGVVQAQDVVINEILMRVNQAREQQGLPRLVWNNQLADAARRHSDDMATHNTLTHIGTDESRFWERMQAAGYMLAVGAENVLSLPDASGAGAYDQWYNSAPHRDNMLSAEYIDIGIGYTRSSSGTYYFTMKLGRQINAENTLSPTANATPPQALPTAISATQTPLPTVIPTRTLMPTVPTDIRAATIAAPLPTETRDPNYVPLAVTNTPLFPSATPVMPATDSTPDIQLIYSADDFLLKNISGRPVNIRNLWFESANGSLAAVEWEIAALSQSLTGFTPEDCVQVFRAGVDVVPRPAMCRYRHAWIYAGTAGQFWVDADFFVVLDGDRRVGICVITAGSCEVDLSTPIDAETANSPQFNLPDIRLIYGYDTFSVMNISGKPLDLRGLSFRSDSGSMPVTRWNTEFLTQPLYDFRDRGCLQVWGLDTRALRPAPAACEVRYAWIAVGDAYDFWRADFTVLRDGVVLAQCRQSATRCDVSLSAERADQPAPTVSLSATPASVTAVDTKADIRLLLDETGVTLLNTSSRTLDISALAFESDNGVFAASRWQIPALSRPLTSLPAGDCLQVWRAGGEYQPTAAYCNVRHAWVAVGEDAQFWEDATVFRVRRGAELLATCETRATICNVNMP